MQYDIIILGSGPAGLTAALYAARGGKKTLVIGGHELGGQMATIHKLENYPGFIGSGIDAANFMRAQAESFGADVKMETAASLEKIDDTKFVIKTNPNAESVYESRAVILATGAAPRKMNITGAREFLGRGVSYCATCDGFFYRDMDVMVVGGGNSALDDALYLAEIARSVTIVYRRSEFSRCEDVLIKRVHDNEKINVMWNTEITEIGGNAGVEYVITNTQERIHTDGVFIAIGHEANTDYLSGDIVRDDMGRIVADKLPAGMFVAGDVKSGDLMQVSVAVGAGATAAMGAIAWLNKR